jgi:hypothetical protein
VRVIVSRNARACYRDDGGSSQLPVSLPGGGAHRERVACHTRGAGGFKKLFAFALG